MCVPSGLKPEDRRPPSLMLFGPLFASWNLDMPMTQLANNPSVLGIDGNWYLKRLHEESSLPTQDSEKNQLLSWLKYCILGFSLFAGALDFCPNK